MEWLTLIEEKHEKMLWTQKLNKQDMELFIREDLPKVFQLLKFYMKLDRPIGDMEDLVRPS